MISGKVLIKSLAALAALIFIGYAGLFYVNREFHERHAYLPTGRLTKDSTPVVITVGKKRLNVPKHYIFDKGSRKDDGYAYLMLIAALPNLTAYSDQTENYYKQRGDVPLVRIVILDGIKNQLKYDRFINLKSKIQNTPVPGLSSKIHIYEYDLNKINGGLKKNDQLILSDSSVPYQLNCSKQGTVPSPHCFAFIKYSDELLLKYYFNRKYIDEWPDIELKINKLIDSFRINDNIEED